ncbi:MHYT domain-containing protein [Actinospica robiniae]|uniref:MHYT domain-containing protein n=1 Tax=Actinospica robiniae TaxID=304901 RepID=UPI00040070F7|nr:MHYT domain-containing protein [Actinospica robiniae]
MGIEMQGSYGSPYLIALAYAMSCVGCGMGLSTMARARSATGRARRRWLALAAVSIGGTGIWVMHFIAMLGYSLPNTQITFNLPLTLVSLAVSVGVVWYGLHFAVRGEGGFVSLIPAGAVTGIGVAGMHYLGMAAMNVQASVHYNLLLVVLSVVIAVTAATVALWFAVNLRAAAAMLGAALLMGVAVTGMHFTGEAAMVVSTAHEAAGGGLTSNQLIAPLVIVVVVSTFAILLTLGLSPSAAEMEQEERVKENLQKLADLRRI